MTTNNSNIQEINSGTPPVSPLQILKTYFGYDSFREGQGEIIDTILSGRDALAIMPTGAGKSLCYQVPALLLPGITLVVSPLISLMQDQVKSLNEAGIHAAYINSSLTEGQINKALSFAARGVYKIIYVAPERLETASFLSFALHTPISMVTVDEAHCISQWGQDFRPSYLKIIDFVEQLPGNPIISAFTATATEVVKNDIARILKLKNPNVVVTGFDRENLYYQVEHLTGKQKDIFIQNYIETHPNESGIIYCATRKNVDTLYEKLLKQGVSVTHYHAGMSNDIRKKSQDDFIYDRAQVVIATNAFGMGIDKSNVRFVIHYNMPQSMENYYQEAGRAGRDGEPAKCILLFSTQDVMISKLLLGSKDFEGMDFQEIEQVKHQDSRRLQLMEGYCMTTSCLRNYILKYFGETTHQPCDNCGNCHQEFEELDMTLDAKWVVGCITEMRGRYGQALVIGTLLGSKKARLKDIGATSYNCYGQLENRTEADLRLLISQMIRMGYITQTEGEYSVLKAGNIADLQNKNTKIIIKKFKEKEKISTTKKHKTPFKKDSFSASTESSSTDSTATNSSHNSALFEALRQLRLQIAKEESVPPYIVFTDRTLIDMCSKLPQNEDEMLNVSGVGQNKLKKYGQRFLQEISAFQSADH
ncbi:DNA helicase RecQ [Blautia faecis]|uniref:DNA helicase RecQ n=1 Tax=Blautia faecis TaxID=871665 RepID=UPI001EE12E32|nr:DNA helicase RecQ [Blautia faecis]MCG4843938.1 DNA helicase RecQ [Blautia faecis]